MRQALDLPIEEADDGHLPSWEWFHPFGLDREAVMKQLLPYVARHGTLAEGAALTRANVPLPLPDDEPRAAMICWPSQSSGAGALIRLGAAGNELIGFWPLSQRGVQTRVEVEGLILSRDRLQAWVRATVGDGIPVCYFDQLFPVDRQFYRAGWKPDVLLCGLPLSFARAEPREFTTTLSPSVRAGLPAGSVDADGTINVSTKGMAAFLPRDDGPPNLYEICGPVQEVRRNPVLGLTEEAWLVRVVVARSFHDDTPFEIDLVVTAHLLAGQPLPQPGEDIAAIVLLLGRVWIAGPGA